MSDTDKSGESDKGDADSSGGLWGTIRRFFDGDNGETSLREQIEEAIAEHEDEQQEGDSEAIKGDLSPVEVTMLRNLLHFSEHDADDVAIPRGKIIAVPADASWEEMIGVFIEHGHSRMPVHRDTLDEVIGMIHMKDVFAIVARDDTPPADWTSLMRQPLYVPQSRNALDLLADMRAKRVHLAVVVNEYSGVDGIVTIEDLVEEIIGEIEDEHDEEPEQLIVPLGEGMWDADARAELDDVAETVGDERLAEIEEAVDTLGGLAFVLAGQLPEVGTILKHPSGWCIEVTAADDTHVTRLRLHSPPKKREDVEE